MPWLITTSPGRTDSCMPPEPPSRRYALAAVFSRNSCRTSSASGEPLPPETTLMWAPS